MNYAWCDGPLALRWGLGSGWRRATFRYILGDTCVMTRVYGLGTDFYARNHSTDLRNLCSFSLVIFHTTTLLAGPVDNNFSTMMMVLWAPCRFKSTCPTRNHHHDETFSIKHIPVHSISRMCAPNNWLHKSTHIDSKFINIRASKRDGIFPNTYWNVYISLEGFYLT